MSSPSSIMRAGRKGVVFLFNRANIEAAEAGHLLFQNDLTTVEKQAVVPRAVGARDD